MLNLYRRHQRSCKAERPEDSRNGEFEERKKGWKKCACPIFASGKIDGKFRRKNTEAITWDEARAKVESWSNPTPPPSGPTPKPTATGTTPETTLAEGVKLYLKDYEADQIASSTGYKYGRYYNRLVTHMNGVGVSTFPDLTAVRIWAYVATWKLEPGTHRNALTRLRTFLDFAVEKNWLETNPLIIKKQRRTRAVRTVSKGKPRIPFTNDELDRMFKACDAYGTEMREHTYTGEDLKDFIALSVYTGLRISDIATFDASRLNADGTVFIRETLKGNVPVSTWVPDWLAARIRYRARVYGSLIFGKHATSNNEVITEAWRRRLRELWEGMGEWKTHPVPHRFRHTFARILLQRHVPASAVAELMGNTEKIVLRHYANYVQERQDATIKVLKKCFADVPQPKFQPAKNNVVRMPRKPTNAALVRQQA